MERSCEGLQNQLWKPSVSLVGGESCKTKPPLVNPRSLNSWLAVDKIRGTSFMRRPPELHVLLNAYLQVFCLSPYQENRLSNPDLKLQGSSSQEDLSVWAMAHPRRDQVPFTAQCGFYSRFFVSQGNVSHLALWVRTVRHRETKWWHQGHTFWQRMKLNPNPLSWGPAVSLRAVGRGSLGLSTGWKDLPCALCPSSLLKPACTFLTLLCPIRFPRTDHYGITFEVTFEYNPVQDLVLQTCLQKWLAAFPYQLS